MVHLVVTPVVSLSDEPVRIRISGVKPNQLVTICASLMNDKGILFNSRAFYHGDAAGQVDLERAEAIGGSYRGALPMGLFWSLRSEKPFHRLMKHDVIGSPFKVTLDVYDSFQLGPDPEVKPVATQTVQRWYVTPGVQRIQIRTGRVRGALFLPPGEGPFPGVIDMFGGVGGLTEFRSGLLASHGFAALSLAYFAYEDLPCLLNELDLEYFEEAAEILLRHPKVLGPKIGVLAVCKGAEIALAMATFLKQVAATVCINGTISINGNSLCYRDIYMRGIPYHMERLCMTDSGAMQAHTIVEDPRTPENQDCVLPLERVQGPILFVVGGKDGNINSKVHAEVALDRMRRHKNKNGQLLFYPDAGHLIEPPGSAFCPMSSTPFIPVPLLWGGELVAHCTAQEHSWREIQGFLQKHLVVGYPAVSKL